MKHKAQVSHFGRDTNARNALIRSLVFALVRDDRITTTLAKAKELRRHADRAVTLARKGTLASRRLLIARYPQESAVQKLMSDIGPRFKTRPGGFTRIIKLGRRPGDKAEMAMIEWSDYVVPTSATEGAAPKKKKAPKKAKTATTKAKKSATKAKEA